MDSIRINNLKIVARHGVYDFEKSKDGVFELDLELYCNLNKSGNSDKLSDTIDYQDLSLIVYSWRQGESINSHKVNESYYGNIFILCKCNDKYVDIDISEYSLIYNELYNDIQIEDTIEPSINDDTTLLKEDTTIY